MSTTRKKQSIPATGLKGMIQNWRNDLIAAISVSLVAMPLGLGVAVASGVPPMAGVVSAIIGGLITTLIRSAHIAINGPTPGLIAIVLSATISLDDGSGNTYAYILAAFICAGALQALMGILKLGKIADLFPVPVINGILAAIGLIIIATQGHKALGTESESHHMMGVLVDVFKQIPNLNPYIAIISIIGLLLLIFHSRISYKFFHFLPAPIWVLFISIPFAFGFNFFEPHNMDFFGHTYSVGPRELLQVPKFHGFQDMLDKILIYPDFSQINKPVFWITVISITLIASVETLAACKAIDKLDPYKRKTNANHDLLAVGVSTMVAGAFGGLPIISVIVRTTVNIHNNAKTRWSNFYHGILILIFVLILGNYLGMIPLAALASILVFMGFKLASPRIFKETYAMGIEQLLFMISTLVITLYSNLLWGILGGISVTLLIHLLLSRVPVATFFQMVFNSGTHLIKRTEKSYELKIKGVANFLNILKIKNLLMRIPAGADVKINLATTRLVDLTVQESLQEFKKKQSATGGKVRIVGLEHHIASTGHKLALKSQLNPAPVKLNPRDQRMKNMAVRNGWSYQHVEDIDLSYLQNFQFFETRPIEYKSNIMGGVFDKENVQWTISDITFDEGALMAKEVYHTTVEVLHLHSDIPKFVLENEGFFDKIFDRVLAFSGQEDIDMKLFPKFSKKFLLKAPDAENLHIFFTPQLIQFLETEDVYHIESNGEALLLFRNLRLARTEDIKNMLQFSKKLIKSIRNIRDN